MNVKIRHKNPGWTDKLKARLKKCAGFEAAVGFPANAAGNGAPHYPSSGSARARRNNARKKEERAALPFGSGPSILDVAVWNNYGTDKIPRRAFMEQAADKMREAWRKMCKAAARRLNAGGLSAQSLLRAGGLMGEAKVRQAMDEGPWPPNAPATQILKGGNAPLKDSHDMLQAVTHIIRERGA